MSAGTSVASVICATDDPCAIENPSNHRPSWAMPSVPSVASVPSLREKKEEKELESGRHTRPQHSPPHRTDGTDATVEEATKPPVNAAVPAVPADDGRAAERRSPFEVSPELAAFVSTIGNSPKPKRQSEELLRLTRDFELFHDARNIAYAALCQDGRRETWPISAMGRQLQTRYYRECGHAPSEAAVTESLRNLEARAQNDGPRHEVFHRVGQNKGVLYVDLCDDAWRSVRLDSKGWQVGRFDAVHFVRSPGMLPLPEPEHGGSLDELRGFLGALDEDAWHLLVAYLAMALQPRGPYPILVLQGPAGAGKSTCARIVRALVDPHKADLTSLPRDEHNLMISASNSRLQAFDNVSDLKPWLSDALCRLATGAAFRTRQLYTNGDETILNEQRPIILNGIGRFIWREDLLSRALAIELSGVRSGNRRSEGELWPAFEGARGRILGALLDATVRAMRERPLVTLAEAPRLMDFAVWGVAIERALKWPQGAFLGAYERMQQAGAQDLVEGSPFATAVAALVARSESGSWKGTPAALLEATRSIAPYGAMLPRNGRGVTSTLQRYENALGRLGVRVERPPRGKERIVVLQRLSEPVIEAPTSGGGR